MRTTLSNAITKIVVEDLASKDFKWSGTLAAPNGSVYGIPWEARRISKFNPIDKSMTEIGPDFEDGWNGEDSFKWSGGAITDTGVIYCPPCNDRGILKIDTNTDTVTVLDRNLLPERGDYRWLSCALALDGCIYFMPGSAHRIMKLDPNNGDAISSVGDDLGDDWGDRDYDEMYRGTVVGIDGCVYGIPHRSKHILKYDPINDTTSFVGEDADGYFVCPGNGALGRDGCIYAFTYGGRVGRVLRIDTTNDAHCIVGNNAEAAEPGFRDEGSWGDAILGIDGCIYWPPIFASRTLKYDPHTNQTSLVGDNYGRERIKWYGGSLASDGVIYCVPYNAERILSIDPWKEFTMTVKNNIEEHPQNFGFLFERPNCFNTITKFVQKIGFKKVFKKHAKPPLHRVCKINFDHAVVKFGQEKVIQVLDKNMKPVNDFCRRSNLCPFMIVASYKESSVSSIYHFLCQDLSWVNGIGNAADKKRNKYKILLRKHKFHR